MHEEAEHEVMACDALEEAAEPFAGAQAAAYLAHHLLAEPVVPHEGHATVLAHVVGGGLADVVQERAEAERLPACELVGERLVEDLAQLALDLPLQLDQALQHLERVPVDVLVVVVALLDVVELGQLWEHRVEQPEAIGECEALHGARGQHQPAELREDALAGRLGHARSCRRGQALRLGVGPEAELRGKARKAERAERIVLIRLRADHPEGAGLDVRPAPERVHELAALGGRLAIALTVKSRFRRSSSIVAPCSGA